MDLRNMERRTDKQNEAEVCIRLERWLQSGWPDLDFRVVPLETPHDENGNPQEFPDFMVWRGHLHTGYGEVKCFEKPLDTYLRWGSLLIDDPKLQYLYSLVRRGFTTQLVYRTADDHILMANVSKLFSNHDQWEEAPEHFMNTYGNRANGKKRARPFKGWLLPTDLFEEIP